MKWLVEFESGEYDDYAIEPLRIFDDRETAITWAKSDPRKKRRRNSEGYIVSPIAENNESEPTQEMVDKTEFV